MGEEKKEKKPKKGLLNKIGNLVLGVSLAWCCFNAGLYAHKKGWVLFDDELQHQPYVQAPAAELQDPIIDPPHLYREYDNSLDLEVGYSGFNVDELEAALDDYHLRSPAVGLLVSTRGDSNGLLFDNYFVANAHSNDLVDGTISKYYVYDPSARQTYHPQLIAIAAGADLALYRLEEQRILDDSYVQISAVDECDDWRISSVDLYDNELFRDIISDNSPEINVSDWSMTRHIYVVPSSDNYFSVASNPNRSFSYTQERLILPDITDAGRSGSPIFDGEGDLIGLVSGTIDDKTIAVPGQVIRKFFDAILKR